MSAVRDQHLLRQVYGLSEDIIKRLRLLVDLADAYIEHLELKHYDCDLTSDIACYAAVELGDGTIEDHYTIRNAKEVLA